MFTYTEDHLNLDEMLGENVIKTNEDAMSHLVENLINTDKVNKDMVARSLNFLIKSLNIPGYKQEFEEENVMVEALWKFSELKVIQKQQQEENARYIRKNLDSINEQIYGNEPIDNFKIDCSLANLYYFTKGSQQKNTCIPNISRKVTQC